jgi:hypothetical protein
MYVDNMAVKSFPELIEKGGGECIFVGFGRR